MAGGQGEGEEKVDKLSMELTEDVMKSMEIGAVFKDYNGKINSLDFHRTNNYLVTASDDEAIRLFDTASATWQKTSYSKKYGVDLICFTNHQTSVLYSSKNGWDESLRHLSLMDNKYLRYFKGHHDRVVSLCMSPKGECFMSGSLDRTVLLWDLRIDKCQGLIRRACFGRPIITAPPTSSCSLKGMKYKLGEQQSTDLQWFQLGMEEAFYLSYSLNCLRICRSTREGRQNLNPEEIWRHMKERQKMFLQHYKAYSHLRAKNWVVRSGLQYGADFVAYRHHPALVHSEYAVIISSESDVRQARLTTWSDWQSTLRLCGSVAKTLLVLSIVPRGNKIEETSPTCLDDYYVEEFEIRRWIAEKHREDPQPGKDKT